jgi:hypothetical protein
MESGKYGTPGKSSNSLPRYADIGSVPGSVYFYAPNKGAPVFFALAFALSGSYHIYQCV